MLGGEILRRGFAVAAAAALALTFSLPFLPALIPAPARAQSDYPVRPIHLVIGFAAGGGNDIFGRLVGASLAGILGQPVVIENRPGAGGRLAAEYVSNQPADGYTLLVGASGAMSIAAAIYPDLKYHPTKTLTPLAMIGSFPLIAVIGKDQPANSVKELVEWAKHNPDKANYATTSPAFTIATELLKLKSGMPGVAIPYKSTNESVLSVIGGQTMIAIVDPPPAVSQVQGGKVKAIAVTGARRVAQLPDVPSMAEAGYPGVDIALWSGVFAPIATPPDIAVKLETALAQAIRDPGVAAKLENMAVDPGGPGGGSPEDFKHMIDADIGKYADVVKAANLHFEE
jgi:tripartite-type tricarboxylate transporter receptor subunit TctC